MKMNMVIVQDKANPKHRKYERLKHCGGEAYNS
jgi:hypothetical protein